MGTRRPGPLGCDTTHRSLASPPGPLGICATTAAKVQPPRARRNASTSTELPILRRGTRGAEVQKLQRQLNARLMPAPKLAVDGIFGPITQRAVLDYQKAMSIDADGVVGKPTWYHLIKGDKATVRRPEPVAIHAHAAGPAPSISPSAPAVKPGVWEWPLEEKFAEALRRTAPKLDHSVRDEFKALLTPAALAMMAGTLVVWAASHAFGVGAVVDVLLLFTGVLFLGVAAFDVAEDLGDFILITSTASSDAELDQASSHLSRAIAVMGVAAFMALLAKVAAKGTRGTAPEKAKPSAPKADLTRPHTTQKESPSKSVPLARPSFTTAPGEAFFWSGLGRGGDQVSAAIAARRGGTTLEQLSKARGIELPRWDPKNPASLKAWDDASRAYAEGASGTVKAVLGDSIGPTSTWQRIELPTLQANPNVARIIRIDPATGAETVIFSR